MIKVQSRLFTSNWTLNYKGELLTIKYPMVMGILNVTPDSFHDGGHFNGVDKVLKRVAEMNEDGADIIDIGGASSRPGAVVIPLEVELERTIPMIKAIKNTMPHVKISIDTWRSAVATQAVEAGAFMINDISAGSLDKEMLSVVADLNVPYVLMHMQGSPENMQNAPKYKDVVGDITHFFSTKLNELHRRGIKDVILDPGFGFGKTLEQNMQILKDLDQFKIFTKPLMVGMSRKSMAQKMLQVSADKALNGTSILHVLAVQNGASIIRTHDPLEAKECIRTLLFQQSV